MEKQVPKEYRERLQQEMRRLEEIARQRDHLKRERGLLLREQPWYRRPGSIISFLAILVSISLFVINFFITQQKKELTITYSKPSSLVLFTDQVRARTRMFYGGKSIEAMFRCMIVIRNTGTKSIESNDFKDGPIVFTIVSSTIPSTTDTNKVPFLLDATIKASAGQRQDILKVESRSTPAIVTYQPSLLNSDEYVELEIFTSSDLPFEIQVQGKILDGALNFLGVVEQPSSQSIIRSPREQFFTALNQMLGAKWVSVLLFMFLFLCSVLLTLYVWDENSPISDLMELTLVCIPSLLSLLFLALSVAAILS